MCVWEDMIFVVAVCGVGTCYVITVTMFPLGSHPWRR